MRVIDNGSDIPGTLLEQCSPEFREAYHQADLVLSKGQVNLETLLGEEKQIFFLLRVKCPLVSRHLRTPVGHLVLHENVPVAKQNQAITA